MRRFFTAAKLQTDMIISGKDAHHIIRVLRFKIGEKLIVVDCDSNIAMTEIVEIGLDFVRVHCIVGQAENTEAPIELILAQCLPKGDKMDFIVQKAVELGASAIYPVMSANCVVKYDAVKQASRCAKWQKIANEAAKQCGRSILPNVASVVPLAELCSKLDNDLTALLCYESEVNVGLRELIATSTARRFLVLIGPEGGFSPAEVALCQKCGMRTVSMGPRILRTETAALAALSVVMYEHGDLGGRR